MFIKRFSYEECVTNFNTKHKIKALHFHSEKSTKQREISKGEDFCSRSEKCT